MPSIQPSIQAIQGTEVRQGPGLCERCSDPVVPSTLFFCHIPLPERANSLPLEWIYPRLRTGIRRPSATLTAVGGWHEYD